MKIYISAKTSYKILKYWSTKVWIFPVIPKNRRDSVKREFFFWFCLSNLILTWLASVYTVFVNRKNILSTTYSWMEVAGFAECIVILIYSKYEKLRLKDLFCLVEKSLENESTEEVERYATSYALIFIVDMMFYVLTIYTYIFSEHPSQNQAFITTATYPLEIESISCKTIVLFNQMFSILYANIIPNLDGIIVTFIFTCTQQLKILEQKLKNSKTLAELSQLIEEHNNILRTAENLNETIKFMVLKTMISFGTNTLLCGLLISNKTELSHLFHMIAILSVLYGRLYLCAESAENMSQAGTDIGDAIYSTNWYNEEPKIIPVKIFIMQMSRKPPVISVKIFMKKLDRRYMGQILYMTYSYIMTLRSATKDKY